MTETQAKIAKERLERILRMSSEEALREYVESEPQPPQIPAYYLLDGAPFVDRFTNDGLGYLKRNETELLEPMKPIVIDSEEVRVEDINNRHKLLQHVCAAITMVAGIVSKPMSGSFPDVYCIGPGGLTEYESEDGASFWKPSENLKAILRVADVDFRNFERLVFMEHKMTAIFKYSAVLPTSNRLIIIHEQEDDARVHQFARDVQLAAEILIQDSRTHYDLSNDTYIDLGDVDQYGRAVEQPIVMRLLESDQAIFMRLVLTILMCFSNSRYDEVHSNWEVIKRNVALENANEIVNRVLRAGWIEVSSSFMFHPEFCGLVTDPKNIDLGPRKTYAPIRQLIGIRRDNIPHWLTDEEHDSVEPHWIGMIDSDDSVRKVHDSLMIRDEPLQFFDDDGPHSDPSTGEFTLDIPARQMGAPLAEEFIGGVLTDFFGNEISYEKDSSASQAAERTPPTPSKHQSALPVAVIEIPKEKRVMEKTKVLQYDNAQMRTFKTKTRNLKTTKIDVETKALVRKTRPITNEPLQDLQLLANYDVSRNNRRGKMDIMRQQRSTEGKIVKHNLELCDSVKHTAASEELMKEEIQIFLAAKLTLLHKDWDKTALWKTEAQPIKETADKHAISKKELLPLAEMLPHYIDVVFASYVGRWFGNDMYTPGEHHGNKLKLVRDLQAPLNACYCTGMFPLIQRFPPLSNMPLPAANRNVPGVLHPQNLQLMFPPAIACWFEELEYLEDTVVTPVDGVAFVDIYGGTFARPEPNQDPVVERKRQALLKALHILKCYVVSAGAVGCALRGLTLAEEDQKEEDRNEIDLGVHFEDVFEDYGIALQKIKRMLKYLPESIDSYLMINVINAQRYGTGLELVSLMKNAVLPGFDNIEIHLLDGLHILYEEHKMSGYMARHHATLPEFHYAVSELPVMNANWGYDSRDHLDVAKLAYATKKMYGKAATASGLHNLSILETYHLGISFYGTLWSDYAILRVKGKDEYHATEVGMLGWHKLRDGDYPIRVLGWNGFIMFGRNRPDPNLIIGTKHDPDKFFTLNTTPRWGIPVLQFKGKMSKKSYSLTEYDDRKHADKFERPTMTWQQVLDKQTPVGNDIHMLGMLLKHAYYCSSFLTLPRNAETVYRRLFEQPPLPSSAEQQQIASFETEFLDLTKRVTDPPRLLLFSNQTVRERSLGIRELRYLRQMEYSKKQMMENESFEMLSNINVADRAFCAAYAAYANSVRHSAEQRHVRVFSQQADYPISRVYEKAAVAELLVNQWPWMIHHRFLFNDNFTDETTMPRLYAYPDSEATVHGGSPSTNYSEWQRVLALSTVVAVIAAMEVINESASMIIHYVRQTGYQYTDDVVAWLSGIATQTVAFMDYMKHISISVSSELNENNSLAIVSTWLHNTLLIAKLLDSVSEHKSGPLWSIWFANPLLLKEHRGNIKIAKSSPTLKRGVQTSGILDVVSGNNLLLSYNAYTLDDMNEYLINKKVWLEKLVQKAANKGMEITMQVLHEFFLDSMGSVSAVAYDVIGDDDEEEEGLTIKFRHIGEMQAYAFAFTSNDSELSHRAIQNRLVRSNMEMKMLQHKDGSPPSADRTSTMEVYRKLLFELSAARTWISIFSSDAPDISDGQNYTSVIELFSQREEMYSRMSIEARSRMSPTAEIEALEYAIPQENFRILKTALENAVSESAGISVASQELSKVPRASRIRATELVNAWRNGIRQISRNAAYEFVRSVIYTHKDMQARQYRGSLALEVFSPHTVEKEQRLMELWLDAKPVDPLCEMAPSHILQSYEGDEFLMFGFMHRTRSFGDKWAKSGDTEIIDSRKMMNMITGERSIHPEMVQLQTNASLLALEMLHQYRSSMPLMRSDSEKTKVQLLGLGESGKKGVSCVVVAPSIVWKVVPITIVERMVADAAAVQSELIPRYARSERLVDAQNFDKQLDQLQQVNDDLSTLAYNFDLIIEAFFEYETLMKVAKINEKHAEILENLIGELATDSVQAEDFSAAQVAYLRDLQALELELREIIRGTLCVKILEPERRIPAEQRGIAQVTSRKITETTKVDPVPLKNKFLEKGCYQQIAERFCKIIRDKCLPNVGKQKNAPAHGTGMYLPPGSSPQKMLEYAKFMFAWMRPDIAYAYITSEEVFTVEMLREVEENLPEGMQFPALSKMMADYIKENFEERAVLMETVMTPFMLQLTYWWKIRQNTQTITIPVDLEEMAQGKKLGWVQTVKGYLLSAFARENNPSKWSKQQMNQLRNGMDKKLIQFQKTYEKVNVSMEKLDSETREEVGPILTLPSEMSRSTIAGLKPSFLRKWLNKLNNRIAAMKENLSSIPGMEPSRDRPSTDLDSFDDLPDKVKSLFVNLWQENPDYTNLTVPNISVHLLYKQ